MRLNNLNLYLLIIKLCGELQVTSGLSSNQNEQIKRRVAANFPFQSNPKNVSSLKVTGQPPAAFNKRPSSLLSFPCGGSFKLAAGQNVTISSPNYPNPYYSWAKCRWFIESIIIETLLKFSCTDFALESSSLCNTYSDFLLVESPSGGTRWFCGSENPEILEAPSFVLTFWSNYGVNYRGFECTIEAMEESDKAFPTALPPLKTSPTGRRTTTSPRPSYTQSKCRCGRSLPNSRHEVGLIKMLNTGLWKSAPSENVTGLVHKQERVINGHPAGIHEFPWLVALEVKNRVICGGNIINDLYILTAAHCIIKGLLPIVIAGEHSISLSDETPYTKRLLVEYSIVHEEYSPYNLDNDVALLKLKEPLDFHSLFPYIAPVCPPMYTNYVGRMATTAGWGRMDESGSFPTDVVNKVEVAVIDLETCQRNLEQVLNVQVTENMLCCSSEGMDVCKGDSGGPLMVKEGNTWLLIGVVSWGYECARKEAPAVYASVINFMDWISKNTEGSQTCLQ